MRKMLCGERYPRHTVGHLRELDTYLIRPLIGIWVGQHMRRPRPAAYAMCRVGIDIRATPMATCAEAAYVGMIPRHIVLIALLILIGTEIVQTTTSGEFQPQ